MARKEKNTVDYFPHPSRHGKKMAYIRKKYGNDGYSTWFIILEQLGDSDRHYLDLSDEIGLMYLETACFVEQDLLLDIIEDLVKLGEFDQELWISHRILFSEKFVDSIRDAYLKRNNSPSSKSEILEHLSISVPLLPQNSTGNTVTSEFPVLKGDGNTQIKLNEIKEDKTILKGMQGENPSGFSEVLNEDIFHRHRNLIVEDFPQVVSESKNPLIQKPPTTEIVETGKSQAVLWPSFEDFWDTYDKKRGDRDKIQKKWDKLRQSEKEAAMAYIPEYIKSQPDKQFRKDPATFLNNKSWNDEIITRNSLQSNQQQPAGTAGSVSRIYQKLVASRGAG